MTGEYILYDFPESAAYDLYRDSSNVHLLITSIHPLSDTNKYDYQTFIVDVHWTQKAQIDLQPVYSRNSGNRRFVSSRINKLGTEWIYTESTYSDPNQDTFFTYILDPQFHFLSSHQRPIHAFINHFSSNSHSENGYRAIGSVTDFPDSLIGVSYNLGHLDVKGFRTEPSISSVKSMSYNADRDEHLVFHLGGLSRLNDTLGVIERYPGNVIRTALHGTVIVKNPYFYSFGASTFPLGNEGGQDLVFQEYDSSMRIVRADTFGRPNLDDYPFIHKSLDTTFSGFMVGGMLADPYEIINQFPLSFFIAKYNDALQIQWYREFGGNTSYLIYGFQELAQGYVLLYGYILEGDIRYPYLLILDENGEITNTKNLPDPDISLVHMLYPPESGNLVFEADVALESFQLYSIDGKAVLRIDEMLPGRHSLDVSGLAPGMYVFVVSDGERSQSGKWVKK